MPIQPIQEIETGLDLKTVAFVEDLKRVGLTVLNGQNAQIEEPHHVTVDSEEGNEHQFIFFAGEQAVLIEVKESEGRNSARINVNERYRSESGNASDDGSLGLIADLEGIDTINFRPDTKNTGIVELSGASNGIRVTVGFTTPHITNVPVSE